MTWQPAWSAWGSCTPSIVSARWPGSPHYSRAMRRLVLASLLVASIAHANGRSPQTIGVYPKPGEPQTIYVATTFGLLVTSDEASAALPEETRLKMQQAAVKAIEAIGYTNVGTLEFLLDTDGSFYFMEMNTRLQVEHPVTELVHGVDLVREQIRIAAGEPLSESVMPTASGQRTPRGHAIELRVNAEDPNNFAPWPGKITALHMPGGLGVRVDTHVYAGYVVPPNYDSLLAKVIVHDVDRPAALRRARRCLDEMVIEGIRTNIPFLRRIVNNPDFIRGDFDTGFVGRLLAERASAA